MDTSLQLRPGRQLGIQAARATGDLGDLPVYVTKEEIQRARGEYGAAGAVPGRPPAELAALIGFLWATGARISEALAVTPGSFDVEQSTVRLPTLKRRRKDGTGRLKTAARVVPLPPKYLAEVLAVIVRQRQTQTKLFDPEDDPALRPVWNIGRKWAWHKVHRALMAAGVEGARARPHAIRHGHAVHAVLHGVPLNLIQRQLGHASIVTTAIYLRVTAQDVREAYGRFEW